ncbi:unnamed protein product [Arctia plantaginis]|nr:unnamed protein product [Arctia plantaginis]
MIAVASSWSLPYPSAPRAPMRFTRFAPPPHPRPYLHANPHAHRKVPAPVETSDIEEEPQHRPKRGHDDYDHDHDYQSGNNHRGTSGVTGPVHTFVKTDKNANYKWGVRHHVGDKYAS